jgi:aminopeptidase N
MQLQLRQPIAFPLRAPARGHALVALVLMILAAALAGSRALADGRSPNDNAPPLRSSVSPGEAEFLAALTSRSHRVFDEARRTQTLALVKKPLLFPTLGSGDFEVSSCVAAVSLDFTAKTVSTSTVFTVKSNTSSLDTIYLYYLDTLSGTPTVSTASGPLGVYDLGQGVYAFMLPTPLATGQTATITVARSGTATCSSYCTVSSSLTYNLENTWIPLLVDQSSNYNFPTSASISVTVPSTYAVGGAGASSSSTTNSNGTVTTTLSGVQDGRFNFGTAVYDVGSSTFGTSKAVRSFLTSSTSSYASDWRTVGVNALAFHEKRYGTYAYQKADIVEVSDNLLAGGAAGVAGHAAVFLPTQVLSTGTSAWSDQTALAHELAHQWFAFMVRVSDTESSPWLNEGFATFAEMEYSIPLATAHYGVDYGPTYRRYGNQLILYLVPSASDVPISSQSIYKADSTVYAVLTYYKGAHVVSMVKLILGETDFFKAMKAYVSDHASARTSVSSLATSLQSSTGKDFSPYLQKWAYGSGYPTFSVSVKRSLPSESPAATIALSASEDFHVPLELELRTADGKKTRQTVTFSGTTATVKPTLSSALVEVRADPDYQLVGRTKGALAGDIHVNGEVDGIDLILEGWAYGKTYSGSSSGGKLFPEWADLSFDGKIDAKDLSLVTGSFGKKEGE